MQEKIYEQNLETFLQLIENGGFTSMEDFSRRSSISMLQIYRLLQGLLPKINVETFLRLSGFLKVSPSELASRFYPKIELLSSLGSDASAITIGTQEVKDEDNIVKLREDFKKEYHILQSEMEAIKKEVQRSVFYSLESLLIQLPTVTSAINQNPDFPAVKLLPLFRPVSKLLQEWNVETIGSVGAKVFYESRYHEILEGNAQEGDLVTIRYVGYKHSESVLYKAKISGI